MPIPFLIAAAAVAAVATVAVVASSDDDDKPSTEDQEKAEKKARKQAKKQRVQEEQRLKKEQIDKKLNQLNKHLVSKYQVSKVNDLKKYIVEEAVPTSNTNQISLLSNLDSKTLMQSTAKEKELQEDLTKYKDAEQVLEALNERFK